MSFTLYIGSRLLFAPVSKATRNDSANDSDVVYPLSMRGSPNIVD